MSGAEIGNDRGIGRELGREASGIGSEGVRDPPTGALASMPPPHPHPHPHHLLALREGGVAGVEGGLAPKERCLPPPGRQKEGGSGLRA